MAFDPFGTMTAGERAEVLAAWYFRFNGFFPLPGFVIHDGGKLKRPGQQLTDADLIAVRLPYTREVIETSGSSIAVQRDGEQGFELEEGVAEFIVAEVSADACKFNWLDGSKVDETHLLYCLRRIGQWPEAECRKLAESLAVKSDVRILNPDGQSAAARIRLISVGREKSGVPMQQVLFEAILSYMHARLFPCYDPHSESDLPVLSAHVQWHPLISEVYWRLRGRKRPSMTPSQVLAWLFPPPDAADPPPQQ